MDSNSIPDHIYSREYLLKQGGTVPLHSTRSKKTSEVLQGKGYLLPENGSVNFLSVHNSFFK
jgi:hypothetical protein